MALRSNVIVLEVSEVASVQYWSVWIVAGGPQLLLCLKCQPENSCVDLPTETVQLLMPVYDEEY